MRLGAGNPMTRVLSVLLVFEGVVFALAIPGMVTVSGRPPAVVGPVAGAAIVLALLAAATLRRRPGYALGWLTQCVALVLGVATPVMFLVGGMFALLWVATFVLGRRLDKAG